MGRAGPSVSEVAAAALLLLLAIFRLGVLSEPGALGAQPEVPQPVNVTVDSYNFNTSVRWDYPNIASKPLFIVEVLCYGGKIEINTCVNISQRYCDLTHKVEKCSQFWVKVKALVGLHESKYGKSKGGFDIYRNGRIGPPKLNVTVNGHEIRVDFEHPLTPYYQKESPLSVTANFTDFSYKVFLSERGSPNKPLEFETDECQMKCPINLHIRFWNTSYCVSAAGLSRSYLVTGEKSEQYCIDVPLQSSLDITMPIIGSIVGLVVLAVILAILYKVLQKRKNKLPEFLSAVVRNPFSSFDAKPEGKYNVITSINKAESPECEENKFMDPITQVNTTDLNGCVKELHADDSQGILSKAGELSNQKAMIVEISESEQNLEDNLNYSKSVRGQEEMCNNLPNLDLPRADMQQPTVLGSCIKESGYDKPHWKSSDSGEELLITQSPRDEPEA
ncbi:interferon gamma receptor 1 isoform X2 [Elgaria multicarinata webbii]|uniref:interferon gamma receptor 1 isoform X2 n=1 Tax=Elgaria multicarinata webbii TaxID=159646 RepID=UPI002FCCC620